MLKTFRNGPLMILVAVLSVLMTGCGDMVLLDPAGDVAKRESELLVQSTFLMLLIVIPVIAMALWFAWEYHESNTEAEYDPDWDHSTTVELYVWAAPLLIIVALGAMTWVSTHLLDPFRPLERISEGKPVTEETKTIEIQAIALEWKWLFIYPEQGIALVNQLAAPVDTPIKFKITSPKMMNSLYIPALAGMVYGMPGMETNVHLVVNEEGDFAGVSGNYSGAGYSHMRFRFKGLSDDDFAAWVADTKANGAALTTELYSELAEPSVAHPVQQFASVEADLYDRILNLCVDPEKMCVNHMMMMDQKTKIGEGAKLPASGHDEEHGDEHHAASEHGDHAAHAAH